MEKTDKKKTHSLLMSHYKHKTKLNSILCLLVPLGSMFTSLLHTVSFCSSGCLHRAWEIP